MSCKPSGQRRMLHIMLVRLCALLALSWIALLGQTPPKDVDGWDKIKWGMTREEACTAYGPKHECDKPGAISIDPVKISDIEMNVGVGFGPPYGPSARISQVQLWMYFGVPGIPGSANMTGASDFDTLRRLLIEKYGAPVNEDSKRAPGYTPAGDLVKTVLWVFPSTSITLQLTNQIGSLPPAGSVKLYYKATDKKALDKL